MLMTRRNHTIEDEETDHLSRSRKKARASKRNPVTDEKSSASTESDTRMNDTTLTPGKSSLFSLKQCLRAH